MQSTDIESKEENVGTFFEEEAEGVLERPQHFRRDTPYFFTVPNLSDDQKKPAFETVDEEEDEEEEEGDKGDSIEPVVDGEVQDAAVATIEGGTDIQLQTSSTDEGVSEQLSEMAMDKTQLDTEVATSLFNSEHDSSNLFDGGSDSLPGIYSSYFINLL